MPITGWTNHDAATLVSRATHIPAAERHELLAMLGLLDGTGTTVAPDPDAAEISLSSINNTDGGAAMGTLTGRAAHIYEGPPPEGRFCPPGLRSLFEGEPPTPPPPAPEPVYEQPAPKPKSTRTPSGRVKQPGVGRGRWRLSQPVIHGPNGPQAHRRRGEEVCEVCKEARRAYDRECKRRTYQPKPRKAAQAA